MSAMHVEHAVPGQMPQPEMERHRAILDELAQPTVSFQQDVLHDVAGINSLGNRAIQACLDHASQRVAMPFQ
jgi:hypothetical protein